MYGVEQAKRFLEAILRPFRILGDIHFQMHFSFAQGLHKNPPPAILRDRHAPFLEPVYCKQALREEKKKNSRQAAKPPRPPAVIPSAPSLRLCEKKKKK